MFAELATMRRAGADGAGGARCSTARRWQGARALGFDADYGTIEPGKRARLLAVARAGRTSPMWKNIWCAASSPARSRWVELERELVNLEPEP